MDLSYLLAYAIAILVGISMGLMGGGGSIITVPALVYFLNIKPELATAYSLFVVGVSSVIGTITYMRQGLVAYKIAVIFALPSFVTVFLIRHYMLPSFPEIMFTLGNIAISKRLFIMVLFAMTMILASYSMIRGRSETLNKTEKPLNYPMFFVQGVGVGFLSGLVGAGGGFLIIPALVILAQLPMKTAVGTSLMIIGINSLLGFTGDLGNAQIDWVLLGTFSSMAVIGILIGSYLTRYISGARLKPAFGWFVLIMGCFVLLKETLFK